MAEATKYPEEITADMLPEWAHISDGEIAHDALETLAEIKIIQKVGHYGGDRRIEERQAFVAFLHRLQMARLSAPPTEQDDGN